MQMDGITTKQQLLRANEISATAEIQAIELGQQCKTACVFALSDSNSKLTTINRDIWCRDCRRTYAKWMYQN